MTNTLPAGSSIKRALQIHAYFEQQGADVLIHYPQENLCEYQGGWNDSKVARHLDVPATTVATVRKETFGGLKKYEARKAERASLSEQINTLELRVTALEGFLKGLSKQEK